MRDGAPNGGNEFVFRGGPFAGGRLLLRANGSLERFFEDGFGRGEI